MNAISYGWWTNSLYQFNDPDHLVLVGKDASKGKVESLGENRARYTTGVVSGMLLVPDVWSLSDCSGRGSVSLSFERAREILMNEEVNRVARLGCAIRPVYGNRQWCPVTGAAENFVMHVEGNDTWLAVINYADQPLSVSLPLTDIGLTGQLGLHVRELWTRRDVMLSGAVLQEVVPPTDARIFHFSSVPLVLSE